MGCVTFGIIFGGLALVLFVVAAAFLGSESEQEVTGYIGIGFLLGAIVSGIISAIIFRE